MKKATEFITCDLRYYQGDITDEMLEVLKQAWPKAYKEYKAGNDISLCFKLDYEYSAYGALAKLAPFFNLATGYSFNVSTSNGRKAPVTSLFEAIHLHIGKHN